MESKLTKPFEVVTRNGWNLRSECKLSEVKKCNGWNPEALR